MLMPREGVDYTVFQGNHRGGKDNSFVYFVFVSMRVVKVNL